MLNFIIGFITSIAAYYACKFIDKQALKID